jgi:hypothetical protein
MAGAYVYAENNWAPSATRQVAKAAMAVSDQSIHPSIEWEPVTPAGHPCPNQSAAQGPFRRTASLRQPSPSTIVLPEKSGGRALADTWPDIIAALGRGTRWSYAASALSRRLIDRRDPPRPSLFRRNVSSVCRRHRHPWNRTMA